MKKRSKHAMRILLPVLALAAVLLGAYGAGAWAKSADFSQGKGESLYQLDLKMTDQDGQKVPLDVYRGQPVVVSLFYASCGYSCPILIDSIKRIESKIRPEARKDLRVILVSFDPENDTPAALKKLAQKHGADPARWKFINASEDSVAELAAILDFRYRKLADGGFNHSSVLTLLDAEGRVWIREEGLGDASDKIVKMLQQGKIL